MEPKAAANLKKHQVSFEEAKSIFFGEFGVQFSMVITHPTKSAS